MTEPHQCLWGAGDQLELLSVVTNNRAMPISVGMTSPNGRAMTVSFDDDFGYQRTKVRRKSIHTRRAVCDIAAASQCAVVTPHRHTLYAMPAGAACTRLPVPVSCAAPHR